MLGRAGASALLLISAACSPSAPLRAAESVTTLVPRPGRSVDAAIPNGFAGAVIIADGATVRYERAFGMADRERRIPHSIAEVWRWASVTKQVTALLVMQDVEARKLSLDQSLADALPSFRGSSAKDITIRDLLRHTSGLPNPEDVPTFYLPSQPWDPGLAFCEGPPRSAPPNGKFEYDSCDYVVLGAILERNAHLPFAEIVDARIAKPLGLVSLGKPTDSTTGYLEGKPEPAHVLARFGASTGIDRNGERSSCFRSRTHSPSSPRQIRHRRHVDGRAKARFRRARRMGVSRHPARMRKAGGARREARSDRGNPSEEHSCPRARGFDCRIDQRRRSRLRRDMAPQGFCVRARIRRALRGLPAGTMTISRRDHQ